MLCLQVEMSNSVQNDGLMFLLGASVVACIVLGAISVYLLVQRWQERHWWRLARGKYARLPRQENVATISPPHKPLSPREGGSAQPRAKKMVNFHGAPRIEFEETVLNPIANEGLEENTLGRQNGLVEWKVDQAQSDATVVVVGHLQSSASAAGRRASEETKSAFLRKSAASAPPPSARSLASHSVAAPFQAAQTALSSGQRLLGRRRRCQRMHSLSQDVSADQQDTLTSYRNNNNGYRKRRSESEPLNRRTLTVEHESETDSSSALTDGNDHGRGSGRQTKRRRLAHTRSLPQQQASAQLLQSIDLATTPDRPLQDQERRRRGLASSSLPSLHTVSEEKTTPIARWSPEIDPDSVGPLGAITFSLVFIVREQALQVTRLRCYCLQTRKDETEPNVYVKIRLTGLPHKTKSLRTGVARGSRSPSFMEEEFKFEGFPLSFLRTARLSFKVFRYVLSGFTSEFVGECSYPLSEATHLTQFTAVFRDLQPKLKLKAT